MPWEAEISEQLHRLFNSGNVKEFQQLLHAHPDYLRDENGTDTWMWSAAMDGQLSMIQALVNLGLDVNESKDHGDPNDPFYQPEGAIVQAAGEGHLEVVRWLLKHGAKINYTVQGVPRCWPLVRAATNGHIEVVKLLVEHGADIHSTWQGINPITQAEDFGKFAVRDYLHSLGVRTLRETTAPDYSRAHKVFLDDVQEEQRQLADWAVEIPGDPPVTLHFIPANEDCEDQMLFTVGLSDRCLPNGRREHACSELRCFLPHNWPITESALKDPIWNWPVEWLKRIVSQLRKADRWPDAPAVFMNGDPPAPLAPNTSLTGWLCLKANESVHAPDYRWIDVHTLFPIYTEELALQSGHEELVERFEACNVQLHIDPQRPNLAASE